VPTGHHDSETPGIGMERSN